MELQWVKEVGFPIAIAAFVLIRLNGKFDRLSNAVYGLISAIDIMNERLSATNHNRPPLNREQLVDYYRDKKEGN